MPIITGITTKGSEATAPIIGAQNAVFSSLHDAFLWKDGPEIKPIKALGASIIKKVSVSKGTALKLLGGSAAEIVSNPPFMAMVIIQKQAPNSITTA